MTKRKQMYQDHIIQVYTNTSMLPIGEGEDEYMDRGSDSPSVVTISFEIFEKTKLHT